MSNNNKLSMGFDDDCKSLGSSKLFGHSCKNFYFNNSLSINVTNDESGRIPQLNN